MVCGVPLPNYEGHITRVPCLAGAGRVSDLLCMSNLSHASILKEHDNNDDFQGRSRRTA